jgi:hypothetical protein
VLTAMVGFVGTGGTSDIRQKVERWVSQVFSGEEQVHVSILRCLKAQ